MNHDLANQEEIERYADAVRAFVNLELDNERFTAIRLQHGVYGQRQEGVQMVRVKLPGGRLGPAQLRAVADVAGGYAEKDVAHITTRQDFQVHYVPLEKTPDAMRRLSQAGLTTREACGNTIRNVTACALSGVCPHERTDVNVHLDHAVRHFLRNPLNQQMPRKFKVSFSGCEADCAQGMMHDLGVVATVRDGKPGFRVVAGGGLGHKPHEAIVVEEFIDEARLLVAFEAVVAMHNRYSDRTKRAKSRIKFLVDRFGKDGFLEKYREEFAKAEHGLGTTAAARGEWHPVAQPGRRDAGAPRATLAQRQPGHYIVPVSVPIGDLPSGQLHGIADLMERLGLAEIRATQDQNLIFVNVPEASLNELRAGLAALGLHEPKAGEDVVACPGASTCRLGITTSKVLGAKISGGASDLRVRVSGCHNGCAQPETGEIGIYGEGRRMHGKLIPHYQTYFGGDGRQGGGLALKGPSVPASRIGIAVERVERDYAASKHGDESFFAWTRRRGIQHINALLADLVEVSADAVAEVARDHGVENDFKVLQLGGGECAGVSQVQIGSNFFAAAHERNYRDALLMQRKFSEAASCGAEIARLIGESLGQLVGAPKGTHALAELPTVLGPFLPDSYFAERLTGFAAEFARTEDDHDQARLAKTFADLDEFTLAVADLCVTRDVPVDLRGALPPVRAGSRAPAAAASVAVQP